MYAQPSAETGHRTPMGEGGGHEITELLIAWRGGDRAALDRLFPIVYEELRRIAHRRLGVEREAHTLGTTALVNEAYLKLTDQTRVQWSDRGHFFAVAANAMRRILVDYARRHQAQKRGHDAASLSLDGGHDEALALADERAETVVALDEALARLRDIDARLASVVDCRFFAGLTEEETAEALGITSRTVRRDWTKAKAWLYAALRE
jgi:RNA polymerase sigma-70 factor, ECF subfamily